MNKIILKIIKITIALLVILYCIKLGLKGGDFEIYMGAAELLKNGESCYNVWIHLGGDNYCGYSYSPIFAIFLIPFTYLPQYTTQVIWLLVNLVFLYRIFIIINWFLPISKLSVKAYKYWVLLALLLSVRFILHNFEMVQMTIFLLFICLEAIYQLEHKKHGFSGLLIATGIVIKIIPIVLIPYLIYRKQFKTVLIALVFVFLFLTMPALIYGWEFNSNLLMDWFNIINFNNPEFVLNQNKNGEGVHSLSGLFAGYFGNVNDTNYPRNIMHLSKDSIALILNGTRLFFILFTFYFLRLPFFKKAESKLFTFWELSYIFCIIPLIFPNQQKYAFFFIVPAVFYLLFYLIIIYKNNIYAKNTFRILIGILILHFILSTLTTDGLIGKQLSNLTQYYKTITFGTFLLIVLLAICHPKKIKFIESIEG